MKNLKIESILNIMLFRENQHYGCIDIYDLV